MPNPEAISPFYLANRRAMISIGPLTSRRHCPYKCPFCYVESESFVRYASWTLNHTLDWLVANYEHFDVIYISGDTDSFATPRTRSGLELLSSVVQLKKDVLFTTRYVFKSNEEFNSLKETARRINDMGNLAIACVSVCQLTHEYLEPRPIKSPIERIRLLGKLLELGWIPILAMRPIMPNVSSSEFCKILELTAPFSSNCVISPYFYDPKSSQIEPNVPTVPQGALNFNIGKSRNWRKAEPFPEVLTAIQITASKYGINIFNDSTSLYQYLNQTKSK